MKITKRRLMQMIKEESAALTERDKVLVGEESYEMLPGTGEEGVSGIASPVMSMLPDEDAAAEDDIVDPDMDLQTKPGRDTEIYSLGSPKIYGSEPLATVREGKVTKNMIKALVYEVLSEEKPKYTGSKPPEDRLDTGPREPEDTTPKDSKHADIKKRIARHKKQIKDAKSPEEKKKAQTLLKRATRELKRLAGMKEGLTENKVSKNLIKSLVLEELKKKS